MNNKLQKIISITLSILMLPILIPFGAIHAAPLDSIIVSVTDNHDTAKDQDNLDYIISIRNNGSDDVSGISVSNTLPAYVSFTGSDAPGFQLNGSIVNFTVDSVSPQQLIKFRVSGKLNLPLNVTGGVLLNNVDLTIGSQTISANDSTNITTGDTVTTPDFSIFLNCVTLNQNNTFTAYFGYLNRLNITQVLDSSLITPDVGVAPPNSLLVGRHDKVFNATATMGQTLTWQAIAGTNNQSAPANQASPLCSLQTPNIGVTPVSSTQLNVNWNSIAGANLYEVYRNGGLLAQVGGTSYNDINLLPSTMYTYNVKAIGNNITSGLSSPVSETTFGGSGPLPTNLPDFSIFVNCIDVNGDGTYTSYFGYQNNRNVNQPLDLSFFTPSQPTPGTSVLLKGRFDKNFSITVNTNTSIAWTAGANGTNRIATASMGSPRCSTPPDGGGTTPGQPNNPGVTRLQINEELKALEIINFNEDAVKIASDCSTKKISIRGTIDGNISFSSIEYSVDGGTKWINAGNSKGLATQTITYDIFTRPLKDQLYGIKFRVATASNSTTSSNTITYLQNCTGVGGVLGSYFQNGFGQGVISNNGDLLYNDSLPLTLFAETIGNISNLKVKLSSDNSFASSTTELSATFDFANGIWSVEIPTEYLQTKTIYIELNATSGNNILTKNISNIVNTQFLDSDGSDKNSDTYTYQLYFFDGAKWEEINYDSEINPASKNDSFKEFNLYSGAYYLKVTYPSGIQYYTSRFTVSVPSIVRVNTPQKDNSWLLNFLESLIFELPVNIYTRASLKDNVIQNEDDKFDLYNSILGEKSPATTDDYQIALFYWNKWNPVISDQLSFLDQIQQIITKRELGDTRKIYILSDDNNVEDIKRALAINKIDLDYIEIKNGDFFAKELRYQSELTILDLSAKSVNQIRTNLSYSDLLKTLISINYIK